MAGREGCREPRPGCEVRVGTCLIVAYRERRNTILFRRCTACRIQHSNTTGVECPLGVDSGVEPVKRLRPEESIKSCSCCSTTALEE